MKQEGRRAEKRLEQQRPRHQLEIDEQGHDHDEALYLKRMLIDDKQKNHQYHLHHRQQYHSH